MLSPLQKLSFKLFRFSFIFMPPFILEWNKNFTQLIVHKSTSLTLKRTVLIVFILCCGCGGEYYNFTHWFVKPREDYSTGLACLLIIAGAGCFASLAALTLISRNAESAAAGINQLLLSKQTIYSRN